jgi:hypothetical protein
MDVKLILLLRNRKYQSEESSTVLTNWKPVEKARGKKDLRSLHLVVLTFIFKTFTLPVTVMCMKYQLH